MRTIGILGGIGPQATIDFERRLHEVSQGLIPARYNEGYPPVVSVFMRHAPVLVHKGRPTEPLTVDPRLLDAARKLGQWADLLAIPSNTPHFFLDEIREASGREVISIVDVTIEEVLRRSARPVGLVGLGLPKIYVERLEQEGLERVVASTEQREKLDAAILRLMEGRETGQDRNAALAAIGAVRDAGAPTTILGCSEIPLLLGTVAEAADLINPVQLLADAVVRAAIQNSSG